MKEHNFIAYSVVVYKDFQPWEKPQLYVQNYDFFYITNQVLTNPLLFLSLFQVDEQMVTVYNSQTKVICPISLLVKAYGVYTINKMIHAYL